MTYEEMVDLARCVSEGKDEGEPLGTGEIAEFWRDLANAFLEFDSRIKSGKTKLPASWRKSAAHAAGHER